MASNFSPWEGYIRSLRVLVIELFQACIQVQTYRNRKEVNDITSKLSEFSDQCDRGYFYLFSYRQYLLDILGHHGIFNHLHTKDQTQEILTQLRLLELEFNVDDNPLVRTSSINTLDPFSSNLICHSCCTTTTKTPSHQLSSQAVTPQTRKGTIHQPAYMDTSSTRPASDYLIQGKSSLWKVVIGLEIHAQITSASKLFSPAPMTFGGSPNQNVSFIDAAIPGTLPMLNEFCVDQVIKTGLALKGHINLRSMFDRKHYFYCDLPTGYQITQWKHPIVSGGFIKIMLLDHSIKDIAIERIQLETDSGKLLHDQHPLYTFIDLNRVGSPLMEIVTEPSLSSPLEAAAFIKKLQLLLKYIGSCDGNMEEGSLRCDANVSVQPIHSTQYGKRCEIKNLNSIKGVMHAIECEAHRHVALLDAGEELLQETRFYDPLLRTTSSGRSKEDTMDYRFLPDPDLLHLVISPDQINQIASTMPELPDDVYERLIQQYGLDKYHASVISNHVSAPEYFEEAARGRNYKEVANWLINELFSYLKDGIDIVQCPISATEFGELLDLVSKQMITANTAKDILNIKFKNKGQETRSPMMIVKELGLEQVCNRESLEKMCAEVISKYPKEAEEYRNGKVRIMKHFVGQIMKITKGQAPGLILTEILHLKIMGLVPKAQK